MHCHRNSSHSYGVNNLVCWRVFTNCTVANAWQELRGNQFPFRDSRFPVNTGDVNSLPMFGTIQSFMDDSSLTITNVTLEGHMLYPGTVQRTLVVTPGSIYVHTFGTGTGSWGRTSEITAMPFWTAFADWGMYIR